MKIAIVDEKDNLLDYKNITEVLSTDISRISALWLENEKKEVLIAQRAENKKFDPGKWGPAVAGTVEEGEDYLDNVLKEAKEEVGLTFVERDLTLGPKQLIQGNHRRYFLQWYFAKIGKLSAEDLTIQEDEVACVMFLSANELDRWFKEKPEDFVKNMVDWKHLFSPEGS